MPQQIIVTNDGNTTIVPTGPVGPPGPQGPPGPSSLPGENDTIGATAITLDTASFNGNLSSADDTVQKAIATLDDLIITAEASFGMVVATTDYGIPVDGDTDGTAEFQAMVDDLGNPGVGAGVTGARVVVPPGEYVFSDTIDITRFSGSFEGAGIGNDPDYVNPGQGTYFRWNGAAGIPMFKVRDSLGVTFKGIRFGGKEGAAPSAAINFHSETSDTVGTNAYLSVQDCHFGYSDWTNVGGANPSRSVINMQTGIHFTAAVGAGNNDQFRIERCSFYGAGHPVGTPGGGIGRLTGETGVKIDNVQSIWGYMTGCTFARLERGVDTNANTTLYNPQFDYCGADIRIVGVANVSIRTWDSERSRMLLDLDTKASLAAYGGTIQISEELLDNQGGGATPGVAFDCYPSNDDQNLVLRDVTFEWPGLVKPTVVPIIKFGPDNAVGATSLVTGHRVEVVNCANAYSEMCVVTGPGYVYAGYGNTKHSRGTIIWDCETTDGRIIFRNHMYNPASPFGGRGVLDKTAIDLGGSVVTAGTLGPGAGVFHGTQRRNQLPINTASYTTSFWDMFQDGVRTNGLTHIWPNDASAAIPNGQDFTFLNEGTATIIHTAQAPAVIVAGSSLTQPPGTRMEARKLGPNKWLLSCGTVGSSVDGPTLTATDGVYAETVADVTTLGLGDRAQTTVMGRKTGSDGVPQDLTPAEARTILDVYNKAESVFASAAYSDFPNFQIAWTHDPAANQAVDVVTANTGYWFRMEGLSADITKILFLQGAVSAGSYMVGLYNNNGVVGTGARPSSLVAYLPLTAAPAAGVDATGTLREITLTKNAAGVDLGATPAVAGTANGGALWAFLYCTDATMKFVRAGLMQGATSAGINGIAYSAALGSISVPPANAPAVTTQNKRFWMAATP